MNTNTGGTGADVVLWAVLGVLIAVAIAGIAFLFWDSWAPDPIETLPRRQVPVVTSPVITPDGHSQ